MAQKVRRASHPRKPMTGKAALSVQRLDLSSHACISCSVPAHLFIGPASPPAPNSWVSPVADTNALEDLLQLSEPRKRKGFPFSLSKPSLLSAYS